MYGIPMSEATKLSDRRLASSTADDRREEQRKAEWQAARTEQLLDSALADTFPASDPLAITQPGGGRSFFRRRPKRAGGEILLTRLDANRLSELAKESLRAARVLADAGQALRRLLDSAGVVASEVIKPDVVTMNSTVTLEDRARGERREATVVYPIDADPARSKVSVISPIGRTLLGMRVGEEADLPEPFKSAGPIKVIKILYQPEATGNFAS
jgi:regulator of nucleoside diphosphate kinase